MNSLPRVSSRETYPKFCISADKNDMEKKQNRYAKNEHNAGSAQGKPSNHVSQRTPKVQLTLDKISNRNSPASGKEIKHTSNQ